jgi:hypothetical protein
VTFASRRDGVIVPFVVVLHVGVIWLLQAATAPQRTHETAPGADRRVTLRLLAAPAVPVAPARADGLSATADAKPLRPTGRGRTWIRSAGMQPVNAAIATRPSAAAEPPAPAASSASAPVSWPSLLDTDATRRAIRASARMTSLADRAAAASDEPRRPSAQERFGADVKDAGKGDCVKGEYLGAGMGLLSLPFLAVASARGACAQ